MTGQAEQDSTASSHHQWCMMCASEQQVSYPIMLKIHVSHREKLAVRL